MERKKDLAVKLKYGEIAAISLYEELQIIRSTQPAEDDLRMQVRDLGRLVDEVEEQVREKENMLIKRRKRVRTLNENVKAIQEMIENELADNKYSEYLMRLFKNIDHKVDSSGSKQSTDEKLITNNANTAQNKDPVSCLLGDKLKVNMVADNEDTVHPEDIEQEALALVLGFRAKRCCFWPATISLFMVSSF